MRPLDFAGRVSRKEREYPFAIGGNVILSCGGSDRKFFFGPHARLIRNERISLDCVMRNRDLFFAVLQKKEFVCLGRPHWVVTVHVRDLPLTVAVRKRPNVDLRRSGLIRSICEPPPVW